MLESVMQEFIGATTIQPTSILSTAFRVSDTHELKDENQGVM